MAGDETVEADETFTVTLSGLDLSALDTADSEVFELVDATAAGKILAPPPPRALRLSIVDAEVAEPAAGESVTIGFTVALVDELGQPASVPAGFSGAWAVEFPTTGSPASAADFATDQALSGTFTFAAETSSVEIELMVVGDGIAGEGDETFTVVLSSLDLSGLDAADSGVFSLADATAAGTITEPPPPPPALELSIADAEVTEPEAGKTAEITFVVSLVDETGQAAPVRAGFSGDWVVGFPTTAAAASADAFAADQALSGTFTVEAGASGIDITLEVAGDEIVEGDETFTVTLSNLDLSALDKADRDVFSLADATATGTIKAPPPPRALRLSIADAAVTEPAAGRTAQIAFTVSLVDELGQAASVPAGFSGSWAVEFPPTFTATATPTSTTTTTTSTTPTTTTSGSPASADDFAAGQALSGTFTVAADTSTVEIVLEVAGDEIGGEGAETFTVTLSKLDLSALDPEDSAVLALADATATGTITEPPPPRALKLSIADAEVTEPEVGDDPAQITFLVSLVDETGQPASIGAEFSGDWWVVFPETGGVAPASVEDFARGQARSGAFTFEAGASSIEISLAVIGDEIAGEGDERFIVVLANLDVTNLDPADQAAFELADDRATGTITEPPPPRALRLRIADAEVAEPAAGDDPAEIRFSVSLVDELGQPASVPAGFSADWLVEFPPAFTATATPTTGTTTTTTASPHYHPQPGIGGRFRSGSGFVGHVGRSRPARRASRSSWRWRRTGLPMRAPRRSPSLFRTSTSPPSTPRTVRC